MTLTLEYNRRAYMAREVDHQTYYAQFATDHVVSLVSNYVGENRIKASADPHFNDISLRIWDAVATLLPTEVLRALGVSNSSTYKDGAQVYSQADLTCIVKAAARKIRGH